MSMFVFLLMFSAKIIADAASIPIQRVSPAVVSINGSMNDMGCRGAVSVSDETTTCGFISYLIDGVSPDIDTSSSDWASQLVTVRRSEGNPVIRFPHVLLTFGFNTPVSVTGIEIDLFHCPDWNIGAPNIRVYPNAQYDLTLDLTRDVIYAATETLPQTSCDSLSTVTITGNALQDNSSYQTFHVVFDLNAFRIEMVYIGEVRFLCNSKTVVNLNQQTSTGESNIKPAQSSIATHYYSRGDAMSTPVAKQVEEDCVSSEEYRGSAVIIVSAVCLLLIVILSTVILVQCLLIIRMRRSSNKTKTYTETNNTITEPATDVSVSLNEAYVFTTIGEGASYEIVN